MQRRFESDPLFQATTAAAAGARAQGRRRSIRTAPSSQIVRATSSDCGNAGACPQHPEHAGAGSAAAVERPLPRDGHERGRRLQPLEGPRGHALARRRTCDNWGTFCYLRDVDERRVLVDRATSRRSSAPKPTRRSSPKGAPSSAARDHEIRDAHRDRRLARRRHRAAPPPHHQPLRARGARSR